MIFSCLPSRSSPMLLRPGLFPEGLVCVDYSKLPAGFRPPEAPAGHQKPEGEWGSGLPCSGFLPASHPDYLCLPKGSSRQGPHTVSPGSAWGSGTGHSLLSPLLPRRAKTPSCYQPRRAALFLHWSSLSPAYSSVNCPSLSSAQSPSLSVPSLAQQDHATFSSFLGVTVIQLSWRPLSRLEIWAFACEWDIRDLDIRIRY